MSKIKNLKNEISINLSFDILAAKTISEKLIFVSKPIRQEYEPTDKEEKRYKPYKVGDPRMVFLPVQYQ